MGFVHVGHEGAHYRKFRDSTSHPPLYPPDAKGVQGPEVPVLTADVSRLTDSSADGILQEINHAAGKLAFWPLLFAASILVALLALQKHPALAAALIALGTTATGYVFEKDRRRRTTPLLFELSQTAEERFEAISRTFTTLASTARISRVTSTQENFDWKRHAGASSFIRQTSVRLQRGRPRFVATNVLPWCLDVNGQELFFFPDRVLVKSGTRFGAVNYENLKVEFTPSRFIEDEGVPRDTQIVERTWRYVRRDGGPDRRFSNNTELPVVLYGLLKISSRSGLNIHLFVSNWHLAEEFARTLSLAIGRFTTSVQRRTSRTKAPPPRGRSARVPPAVAAAYKELDLEPGAGPEEAEVAFRNLAKLYHPDRVHHLDRRSQALAAERMCELNDARHQIKQFLQSQPRGCQA